MTTILHTTTLHRVSVAVLGIRWHVICDVCGCVTSKPVGHDEAREIRQRHGGGK